MNLEKFYTTSETIESKNYPYGFRLRTSKFDSIEFSPRKGFRHVSRTINPKTNKLNKPKASTYNFLLVLAQEKETGHTKNFGIHSVNSEETFNQATKFIHENFDLFTPEQIEYFYGTLYNATKMLIVSKITYCNAKKEDLLPLFKPTIERMLQGFKTDGKTNLFDTALDIEAINKCKEEGFSPFKTTVSQAV